MNVLAVPSHDKNSNKSKLKRSRKICRSVGLFGATAMRDHELTDKWKMIGSNPRERRAVYGYAQRLDRPVDKNMIDSEQRKSRRESANGSRRLNEFPCIAQASSKRAIWSRTAQTIEVTE